MSSIDLNQSPRKRKVVSWKTIRYTLIGCLSAAFWSYSAARPAQALVFKAFSDYLAITIGAFMQQANAGALVQVVTSALGILPWLVIVLAGSIIIWQSYAGYQEYQRENYSGIAKPVANILVTLILIFLTDKITEILVQGAGVGVNVPTGL
jgi:hypothetical protein